MKLSAAPPFTRKPALVVLLVCLALTLTAGHYFYRSADERWHREAISDMERVSDFLPFWIQLAYEPLIGLSMLLQGSPSVTQDAFFDAMQLTSRDDVSIGNVAYGFVVDNDAHPTVTLSSNDAALLTLDRDLGEHAGFLAARDLSLEHPNKVIAGPVFRDDDGLHKLFFAMQAQNAGKEGALVALIDLETLLTDLHVLHVPAGLQCVLLAPGLTAEGLAPRNADPAVNSTVVTEHSIRQFVAGAEWVLQWRLRKHYLGGPLLRLSVVVLLTGGMISVLAAIMVHLWLSHRDRARQLDTAYQSLQEATEQLIKSEKLASLGSLVAGIAHEMNTPIGNSLTVATALQERADQFARSIAEGVLKKSMLEEFLSTLKDATSLLEHNTRRAAHLVGDFKQVAVDQSSERRRVFDLKVVIDEVLWTLKPRTKHTSHQLVVDIPDNIRCDSYPGALGQILTNLVSNSLDHGFEGMQEGRIDIHAHQEGDKILLSYTDNGCGIPEQHVKRIFDPFFTTRLGKGGSGLGLHIIYNLVTGLLGGEIALLRADRPGVHFLLTFPSQAPNKAANSAA